jgi:hypothetical protein
MTRRSGLKKHKDAGFATTLTPRGRDVLRAFVQGRRLAPGFLASSGLLPEVSESCSDQLHRVVHKIASTHFDRRRHARALQTALRRTTNSRTVLDVLEGHHAALQTAESTAAYVFGLAVGLAMSALPDRL